MRNASSALAYATVTTARNLKAACIITPTVSGATAELCPNLNRRQRLSVYHQTKIHFAECRFTEVVRIALLMQILQMKSVAAR